MSAYADGAEKPHDPVDSFDKRDARALTECMTVLPEGGDVYTVVSESGNTYSVDGLQGTCTCRDFQHNLPTDDGRETCKHYARAMFATGQWAIPEWADSDAVDPHLGEHVDGSPRVAATDGGVTVESDADAVEGSDTDTERPEDCDCGEWNDGDHVDLPCWPCYRDGFESPNPDATGGD